MARRTLNRKDLRAQAEAAERLKQDEDETEEGDEEEEESEDEADEDAGEEADEAEDEDVEVDEEKPPPKKKKAPAKPAKAKSRARPAKITRMKVVWGVFNNSNQRVATFDYPKRKDADDLATKLSSEKKNTHFVQPVKEPIEEK